MVDTPFSLSNTRREQLLAVLLTLCAAAVRLWRLGDLGLSYDEAASALMARASVPEIIAFHWTAGFEHPPLWQLLMWVWSLMAGQSEYALRVLPALTGILAVPLLWQLARRLFPKSPAIALVSAGFAAFAPILIYYSQDARMYTIVLVLAIGSMMATVRLVKEPSWNVVWVLALLNGFMTGVHYYSALLLAVEGLYFLSALILWPPVRQHWLKWFAALGLSALPLLLWMAFSPGFHMTVDSVLAAAEVERTPVILFLDEFWRDLSFGSIRWQPEWAWIGYVLVPFLLIGLMDALWLRRHERWSRLSAWLVILLFFVPILFSAILFGGLSTRYLLFIMPALVLLISLGIVRLWCWARPLGLLGAMLVLVVCLAGFSFYRIDYAKSEYREMTEHLESQLGADDGVLIESPRQHLSAKYYLAGIENQVYPVPNIELPDYWPVTAPPVVPEEVDGDIQDYLRRHPSLWLSLTGQDEVDLTEFLSKYLSAVSYQVDCDVFLDVDLCQYASPMFATPNPVLDETAIFESGLTLESAAVDVQVQDERRFLLVELKWLAEQQPTADVKVSLRLLDETGAAVEQRDNFPIGPLLPPTTWAAGDRKPGYMALAIPPTLESGRYQLVVTLYDPATFETTAYSLGDAMPSTAPLVLANVEVGDTIKVVSGRE